MRTVFLVPRRKDNGPRDALWAYCRARWEMYFPEIPIYEGHHDTGPFNRSAAVNLAAKEAGEWDLGIVIDSDVLLAVSQVRAAIERATETGRVTWAHRRWRGIREDMSVRLAADQKDLGPEPSRDELDLWVERTNPISWSCCIVIPRPVWDDLGGFDERFLGWGFEDMAFQSIVVGLYGHERIEGDVIHLWHPRSEERIVKGQGRVTASPEYVTNARLGRRYMVAVRRDHGLTDRHTPTNAAEMERDIANLKLDDAQYEAAAKRHGLPDWSGWWPTLEELRDGAKEHRLGPEPTVTLIFRTGGEPETWPERSEYLRRSIASLAKHVTGSIVQRVVYSDWGPDFRAELDTIAEPHGFYVVGPERHVGYVASAQQLWRYIKGRAKGEYVFAVEDDFLYERDVDLTPMIEALQADPGLRQIALLRAAFYEREKADGILGWPSEEFTPKDITNGHGRLEHRLFWTMNPSLFHRSVTAHDWPTRESSERVFGDLLLRDPAAKFAFWGDGQPWISHIGAVRAGTAY